MYTSCTHSKQPHFTWSRFLFRRSCHSSFQSSADFSMSIKRTLIVTFTASETQKLWKCKTLCSALILPCQKATESINLDLKYSILYCLGSDSLVHSIGFVNALPLPCPMNTMLTEVRLITDTVLSKDYTPFIIVNPDLNVVLDIQTDYQILLRLRSQCKGKGD